MYGTSDKEGSTGLFVQIVTYKFGSKIEDVEDSKQISGIGETIRRGERYWSFFRPREKGVQQNGHAKAMEDTWLNWETSTHHAWRLRITWGADASSGRRHPKHTMKVRWRTNAISRKREKTNSARARRVQERKRKPLRQRLRRNDNRALALRGWVSKLRKVQAKARAQGSRHPKWQNSVTATAVNKSKKLGHQTRLHRHQVCLKWTRLGAPIRDSEKSRWKTARNVSTRWIGKISPIARLRSTS